MTASGAVDLRAYAAAKRYGEIMASKFASEKNRARRAGLRLLVKVDTYEQVGRGKCFVARARLVPESDNQRRRFSRMENEAIEARAEFTDRRDIVDALDSAIKEAFEFGRSAGVI